MSRNNKNTTVLAAFALLFGMWATAAGAKEDTENQLERARKAADVLSELMRAPDSGIPQDLLERAEAIAVVPNVLKAAFGIGGSWGKGLISVRENGRWTAPAFIDLSGGSIGFQIGGQSTDVVLVFTDKSAVRTLLDSKLKLGADASIAAGPVGRHGSVGTDLGFNSAVYSYSRSKGLFAGLALDGAVMSIDDSANHKVYGENISGTDILVRNKVRPTSVTASFLTALNRYSPRYLEASARRTGATRRDSQATSSSREIARTDIPRDAGDQAERAVKAADVLQDLVKTPDRRIPQGLLDRAYGIAVIPNVVKAAFGVGGRWGKGLMSVRENGKWSAPAYIQIAGGSFGPQLGAQATDLVLVFTERDSVRSLLDSKLKLGADASIAAGPVGRGAEAGTDAKLNAAVYSYSRSKGLFAGISLDGAVISMDDSANHKVYGENVTGRDILINGKVPSSGVTAPFMSALREYTPRMTR